MFIIAKQIQKMFSAILFVIIKGAYQFSVAIFILFNFTNFQLVKKVTCNLGTCSGYIPSSSALIAFGALLNIFTKDMKINL